MIMTDLTVILGNQLCRPSTIPHLMSYPVFMCESDDLCSHFKYHQLKIIFFLIAMREFKDELTKSGVVCHYHQLKFEKDQVFTEVLRDFCTEHHVKRIHILDIEDRFFKEKFNELCSDLAIDVKFYESPLFLSSHKDFKSYLESHKKPFMKTFYQKQRTSLNILMNEGKPLGGRWSFDEDNRKKTPKNIVFPTIKMGTESSHLKDVQKLVREKFKDNIGGEGICWFPVKRTEVDLWCDDFLEKRFKLFGDYEDAIDNRSDFLFHSALSLFLNCGLITPSEILIKLQNIEEKIPLNSLEGFVRQIIGWREFIRGIYHNFDELQQKQNFFNHQRKLTPHWYTGTTGIIPLDDAINQTMKLGYTHHINRLMVIGNIMLLCRVHPQEVYRWFMESYIDSSDWVMGPNVFGMSQFSDGGIFATKPYFCGSNYIRKMSHYSKGEWCDVLDALYWQFIIDNQEFFSKNFRLKFMVSKLKSFTPSKVNSILSLSNSFIEKVTT